MPDDKWISPTDPPIEVVGATGDTGERGRVGLTGMLGPQGPKGDQGEPGPESRTDSEWEAFRQVARNTARSVIRLTIILVALGVLVAAYIAVQLHDLHIESCGPANRPDSKAEARMCDLLFPTHEHPVKGSE